MTTKAGIGLSIYFLLIAAIAGAAVLALEVLAARTMAPALGGGAVAWAVLLAVALGSLAIGNLIGGLLADRVRPAGAIVWSLTVAAVALVFFSQFYGSVMRWASGYSLFRAALVAASATQCVPMLMLGLVTPVLVKAGAGIVKGRWAGAVLACGSGGGIVGALAMGLALLPSFGLRRCYLLIAAALILAILPAIWRERRWPAGILAIVALAAAIVLWCTTPDTRTIQSRYGQIEILENETGKTLLIDGMPQTTAPDNIVRWQGFEFGYLLEMTLMSENPPENALVIGLGAGLAPRLLAAHGVSCESVEIDPRVVEVARQEFGFDGHVKVADGRIFLARTPRRWDLIVMDVCTSDALPFHLFTKEALETARDRLSDNGVLAIQFISDDARWSASVARTANEVFGSIVMLRPRVDIAPVGPRWLFTGLAPLLVAEDFEPDDPYVPWQVVDVEGNGRLLTDDHFGAELDWARTAMLWRRLYALSD